MRQGALGNKDSGDIAKLDLLGEVDGESSEVVARVF
jgi:hypothetical protein